MAKMILLTETHAELDVITLALNLEEDVQVVMSKYYVVDVQQI